MGRTRAWFGRVSSVWRAGGTVGTSLIETRTASRAVPRDAVRACDSIPLHVESLLPGVGDETGGAAPALADVAAEGVIDGDHRGVLRLAVGGGDAGGLAEDLGREAVQRVDAADDDVAAVHGAGVEPEVAGAGDA